MQSLQSTMPAALRALLARGPLTPGKLGFAWTMAVGPALSRVTRADLGPQGRVVVHAADERWRLEVERQSPVIAARLRDLLGPDAITGVAVDPASQRRR